MKSLTIDDIINFLNDRFRKQAKTVVELSFLDKNDKIINLLLGVNGKENIRKYMIYFKHLFEEKDGYFVNKVSGFKFLNVRDYDGTSYNGIKREMPIIREKKDVKVNENDFIIKKARSRPVSQMIGKNGEIKYDIINLINKIKNKEIQDE